MSGSLEPVDLDRFSVKAFKELSGAIESQDKKNPALKFIPASEMRVTAPDWIVRGWLEADSLCQLFGQPGSGKSFVAIDLACCVAAGTPWAGHSVKLGVVAYVAGEGRNGLARRIQAWAVHHGCPVPSKLFFSDRAASLIDNVEAVIEALKEAGVKPILFVVDTLNRNFGPGSENDAEDMQQFIIALDMIKSTYRCAVMVVHHSGHANQERSRGHSSLYGALDFEYQVEKNADRAVTVKATKTKDFEEPAPAAFMLKSIDLPCADDEGKTISSAILEPTEYTGSDRTDASHAGTAIRLLRDLEAIAQTNVAASGRDGSQARVMLKHWQSVCYQAWGAKNRQRFGNVKKALESKPSIAIDGDFVRTIDPDQ